MEKLLNLLKSHKGKKNFTFAAVLVLAGVLDYFVPSLNITVLGMNEPQEFIMAGIAWALGRDALNTVSSVKK